MNLSLASIRRYYDQNTPLFLAFARGHTATTIHRALWMDGVHTLDEALNATHSLILSEIAGGRVADLGCGVGASLFHILPQLAQPAFGLGLTVSPVQAQFAQRAAVRLGLTGQAAIVEGDFLSVPLEGETFDAVYSVEAFCHALEPAAYFGEAARLLRPGGRLVLVDDFCAERDLSPAEANWMAAYRSGWYVPGVSRPSQVIAWAAAAKLRLRRNDALTPYLRLNVLNDRLARLLLTVGQALPLGHAILPSMLGSMALQQSLAQGIVEYRLLSFEKDQP